MGSNKKIEDKKKLKEACEEILKIIRPGDVVNQVNRCKWWEFWLAIGFWGIRNYQKRLFGRNSNWKDDHCMIFFNKENTFSVELPKAVMKPLTNYCLTDISIYRIRNMDLKEEHINVMRKAADKMVGTDYDIGQLLDIAINGLIGYEHQFRVRIFDFGKKKKVCSVGVRASFEYLYKEKLRGSDPKRRRWLFNELNPEKWPKEKIKNYKGTDIEATTPAHFANSDYFSHEFELIARFKDGVRIYPKKRINPIVRLIRKIKERLL